MLDVEEVTVKFCFRGAAAFTLLVGSFGTGTAAAQAPAEAAPPAAAAPAPAPAPAPAQPPPAAAQPPPAAAPAPQGYPPPAGYYPPPYGYPPPGYYPPPGQPPAPTDDRPKYLPYREGEPAPTGYYLEERARRGPIIAGAIVFGIPYALGLSIAAGADFDNQSGYLAIPVAGPWITMAARDECDDDPNDYDIDCAGDSTLRTFLVLDGLMQATGAALFIWGVTSKTHRYVRNDVGLRLSPARVGKGYGFAAVGWF